jgi:hypothetical protein
LNRGVICHSVFTSKSSPAQSLVLSCPQASSPLCFDLQFCAFQAKYNAALHHRHVVIGCTLQRAKRHATLRLLPPAAHGCNRNNAIRTLCLVERVKKHSSLACMGFCIIQHFSFPLLLCYPTLPWVSKTFVARILVPEAPVKVPT